MAQSLDQNQTSVLVAQRLGKHRVRSGQLASHSLPEDPNRGAAVNCEKKVSYALAPFIDGRKENSPAYRRTRCVAAWRLFFGRNVPRVWRCFLETRMPAEENEIQHTRGAVALLRYDQLRLSPIFLRHIGVVEIGPIDE